MRAASASSTKDQSTMTMTNEYRTLWKFLILFAVILFAGSTDLWITQAKVRCDSEGVAKSIVPRLLADDYPGATQEDTVEGVKVIGFFPDDNSCNVEVTTNNDLVMKYNFHYDGDYSTATLDGPLP
jgi:hypothetical protein